jgi:hypothetical protein
MYVGYVFVCGTPSLKECLKSRVFTCAGDMLDVAADVEKDAIAFLYNTESQTLVGPFTIASSAKSQLVPGAWVEKVDDRSLSVNFKIEWEQLHEIKNPQEKFPFVKDINICKLSHYQTLDLLNALKEAPLFKMA